MGIPRFCEIVANGDWCTLQACIVETTWIKRSADMLISGADAGDTNWAPFLIEPSWSHEYAGWDYESECMTQPGVDDRELACCGEYPDRFPYKVSRASCCDNKKSPA